MWLDLSFSRSISRFVLLCSAAVALLSSIDTAAEACDPVSNQPFEVDPADAEGDTTPPGAVTASVEVIELTDDGVASETDCDDLDHVTLHVETADYAPDEVGYLVTHVEGDLLGAPEGALQAPVGQLHFYPFVAERKEHFRSLVSIVAVDRAGNEGPPTELDVQADVSSGGCSTSRAAGSGSSLVAVVCALLTWTGVRRRSLRGQQSKRGGPRQASSTQGPLAVATQLRM